MGVWAQGGTRGMAQEGTCWRLAAAALPPDPTHPRVPAAQLVPWWHVTNGDMLLLACFVRWGGGAD